MLTEGLPCPRCGGAAEMSIGLSRNLEVIIVRCHCYTCGASAEDTISCHAYTESEERKDLLRRIKDCVRFRMGGDEA